MAGGVRVYMAFGADTLDPTPEWTDVTVHNNLVSDFTIDRGRTFELDQTDTGRAAVTINDVDNLFDTFGTGPYAGSVEPLTQIKCDLHDPCSGSWATIYKGYVTDYEYDIDPSERMVRVNLACADAFEILAATAMQPDSVTTFGDPPPITARGSVFFDNASEVRGRIYQVLGNAGWPSELMNIFSGNVSLYESTYTPGESVLTVLQDAADSEFPGIGNLYVDKRGVLTFHGRFAKFRPSVVIANNPGIDWDFRQFKAGDGAAVLASPSDTAQIRALTYTRGVAHIVNFASASSITTKEKNMKGQNVKNSTSIGLYGYRTWSRPNLFTEHGTSTGNNSDDECKLFAQYYVDNYAAPRERISQLQFRSLAPWDDRAAPNWDLLCNADISDHIAVWADWTGGGTFFNEGFYIEGVHYDIKPLRNTPDDADSYADVTMTLDLSPDSYYPADYWG